MLTRQFATAVKVVARNGQRSVVIGGGASSASMSTSSSPWSSYDMAPLDPIIGLTESFLADSFPQKVNVGVGAYRSDLGKPYVLPCVRKAEQRLVESQLDMEYSGIVCVIFFINCCIE